MLQNSYEEMLLDFMKKVFYLFYYSMWVFLRDLYGGIVWHAFAGVEHDPPMIYSAL